MTGVTADDFHNGVPWPVVAGVSYTVSGGPTKWILTVGMGPDARVPKSFVFSFLPASGVISPTNQGSDTPLSLTYTPPLPTFSSVDGPTGTLVSHSVITFTATFTYAVTGVAVGDFGLSSTNGAVGYTTAVSSSDNLAWVLTVTLNSGFAATDFAVTMPRDSGAIVDKNMAATNNGFKIKYKAPTPVLSSATGVHLATTRSNVFAYTATFDADMTGVTAAAFGIVPTPGTTPFTTVLSVPGGGDPASHTGPEWILTITLTDPGVDADFTSNFGGNAPGVVPPHAAATNTGYTLKYRPLKAVISSAAYTDKQVVTDPKLRFTATFAGPVSGVTVTDFTVVYSPPGHGNAVLSSVESGTPGATASPTWVLTLDVAPGRKDMDVAVTMNKAPGAVSPPVGAATNTFTLKYAAAVALSRNE